MTWRSFAITRRIISFLIISRHIVRCCVSTCWSVIRWFVGTYVSTLVTRGAVRLLRCNVSWCYVSRRTIFWSYICWGDVLWWSVSRWNVGWWYILWWYVGWFNISWWHVSWFHICRFNVSWLRWNIFNCGFGVPIRFIVLILLPLIFPFWLSFLLISMFNYQFL